MDTSVVIPYVMQSHPAHLATRRQLAGRQVVLTTHSLAESYSVLTRLPGDARSTPTDAAALLAANFPESIAPDAEVARRLPDVLAPIGLAGGAVYDALVGRAAAAAHSASSPAHHTSENGSSTTTYTSNMKLPTIPR